MLVQAISSLSGSAWNIFLVLGSLPTTEIVGPHVRHNLLDECVQGVLHVSGKLTSAWDKGGHCAVQVPSQMTRNKHSQLTVRS